MISVLTDSYNMGILIFLVILGTMVCLMNRAGGYRSIRTLGERAYQDKSGCTACNNHTWSADFY